MSSRFKILIPLPSADFDPTESAVPWQILTERNF
ncbi:DJ-1/PfpI domain protein, partial [Leptospira ellisii]|nr:DJ-1/PfpI domain protein [Leptospira ellisii]